MISGTEERETERKEGRDLLARSFLISRIVTIMRAYKYDGITGLATPMYCNSAIIYCFSLIIIK